MSPEATPRSSTDRRGLLRATSFDEVGGFETAVEHRKYTNGSSEKRNRLSKAWKESPPWLRPRCMLIALGIAAALLLLSTFYLRQHGGIVMPAEPSEAAAQTTATVIPTQTPSIPIPVQPPDAKVSKWEKPTGFKIIGLIFFGRPPVVEILDCYLKRNLASNGGFLDEVHWVVNTDKKQDIQYLDDLLETSIAYKKINIPSLTYNSVWEHAVERDHMYIKIDDDMVYFDDNAIANIVFTKMTHPDSLDVVANLVNSPETGWLHYHVGAVHAYLPEKKRPSTDVDPASYGPKAWRASALPIWNETGEMNFPLAGPKPDDGSTIPEADPGAPPYKGHRWLPLPDNERNLYNTPIAKTAYDPYGPDWTSWAIPAQVHYSLLENLEKNQLSKYHYGSGLDNEREGIWNMQYGRMNINFMAIWGYDVLDNLPFSQSDDEHELSVVLTTKLRRPLLVNTHAIAAHFSFRTQHELYETDLLSRYRAYANEFICTADNQIPTST